MFAIPTLQDLVERTRRAFRANLPGSDAWLWPNNVNPTAKVIGGAVHELFGFADFIQRQKFALTADGEHLDLHGAELGLARLPAAPAAGKLTLTVGDSTTVALGALFQRADGVQYSALAPLSLLTAGTLDVPVVAATNGAATNAIAGTPLAALSGVTGDVTAEVGADGLVGGADVEDDEAYRARILFRKRNPPH